MFEYILREIFLSVIAFLAGAGVSAGVFAFVLVIGVVPRILRCSRIENIILIENVMICGVVAGNISSVLDTAYNLGFANMPKVPVSNICGNIIIAIYGLCVGIFVGCIAVALAEILHTFPIIYKRMKLRAGLGIIVISMAIGKALGALYYFLTGFVALLLVVDWLENSRMVATDCTVVCILWKLNLVALHGECIKCKQISCKQLSNTD